MTTESRIFHIGIDDTDSEDGLCTTFLIFNLVKYLQECKKKKTRLVDYPNLIRLNPNIPWKTRGNGALVLRIESELNCSDLFKICKKFVDRFSTNKKANAGLAILEGEKIPTEVLEYSRRALFSVQSLSRALSIMDDLRIGYYGRRAKQGLVGALAGIGNELKGDYTFELIAYRKNCRIKRNLDRSRIIEMDRRTRPYTFNSYDAENDRVLVMPHGRDPVLLGIRGETPRAVKRAFEMLLPVENLLGYMIFRSNQGTGEHLLNVIDLSSFKAYSSGKLNGTISTKPHFERGGHVFFLLRNEKGEIPCAAYEPTGRFRMKVMSLVVGDVIEVGGGVRKRTAKHQTVLNLEYFIPRKLAPSFIEFNPRCPKCYGRMSSQGRDQGFRCERCDFASRFVTKSKTEIHRELIENRLYLPDLKAHRHLTKPLQRHSHPMLQSVRTEMTCDGFVGHCMMSAKIRG
jgi:tRNA(Ile2)-agmatinylcytidine synthase